MGVCDICNVPSKEKPVNSLPSRVQSLESEAKEISFRNPAGGAEAGVAGGVRADDRGRLGEAVALEHGHAHGAEEALQFDVQLLFTTPTLKLVWSNTPTTPKF